MSDVRVPDLNNVLIAGRLTRDPESKDVNGVTLCKLSIANTRYYRGKDGEKKEDTVFVDVTVWEKTAEWVAEKLRKGRPVLIEGRLKDNRWQDKETGKNRSVLFIAARRVTPLDWDEKTEGTKPDPEAYKQETQAEAAEQKAEDDIPF